MKNITLVEFIEKFGNRIEEIWEEIDELEDFKPLLSNFQKEMWMDYREGRLDENLNDTSF